MKAYGIGRLTKDIEIRTTQNGKKVASFTLACRRTKDITDFVSCIAWENRADLLRTYTHKGSKIFVEGDVQARNYDDPNYPGRKVFVTEILVNSITLCDSKPQEATPLISYVEPATIEPTTYDPTDDELPF